MGCASSKEAENDPVPPLASPSKPGVRGASVAQSAPSGPGFRSAAGGASASASAVGPSASTASLTALDPSGIRGSISGLASPSGIRPSVGGQAFAGDGGAGVPEETEEDAEQQEQEVQEEDGGGEEGDEGGGGPGSRLERLEAVASGDEDAMSNSDLLALAGLVGGLIPAGITEAVTGLGKHFAPGAVMDVLTGIAGIAKHAPLVGAVGAALLIAIKVARGVYACREQCELLIERMMFIGSVIVEANKKKRESELRKFFSELNPAYVELRRYMSDAAKLITEYSNQKAYMKVIRQGRDRDRFSKAQHNLEKSIEALKLHLSMAHMELSSKMMIELSDRMGQMEDRIVELVKNMVVETKGIQIKSDAQWETVAKDLSDEDIARMTEFTQEDLKNMFKFESQRQGQGSIETLLSPPIAAWWTANFKNVPTVDFERDFLSAIENEHKPSSAAFDDIWGEIISLGYAKGITSRDGLTRLQFLTMLRRQLCIAAPTTKGDSAKEPSIISVATLRLFEFNCKSMLAKASHAGLTLKELPGAQPSTLLGMICLLRQMYSRHQYLLEKQEAISKLKDLFGVAERSFYVEELLKRTDDSIPGVKGWLMLEVDRWLTRSVPGMLLMGGEGMGKSNFLLQVCRRYRDLLGSAVFFQFGMTDFHDATKLVKLIALQLAGTVPDLWRYVLERASQLDPDASYTTAFEELLAIPFRSLASDMGAGGKIPGAPILVVVDALDEAAGGSAASSIAEVLVGLMQRLPADIRIIMSSRTPKAGTPAAGAIAMLQQNRTTTELSLDSRRINHRDDMKIVLKYYFDLMGLDMYDPTYSELLEALRIKSNDQLLYLTLVYQQILRPFKEAADAQKEEMDVNALIDQLPDKVDGLLLEKLAGLLKSSHDKLLEAVLEVLVVVRQTELPLASLACILQQDPAFPTLGSIKQDAAMLTKELAKLEPFFIIEPARDQAGRGTVIRPYHKSVVDFLTDPVRFGSSHCFDPTRCHRRMADALDKLLLTALADRPLNGPMLKDSDLVLAYALKHIFAHCLKAGEGGQEIAQGLVSNIRFLKALASTKGHLGDLKSVLVANGVGLTWRLKAFQSWLVGQNIERLEEDPMCIFQAILLYGDASRADKSLLESCLRDDIPILQSDSGYRELYLLSESLGDTKTQEKLKADSPVTCFAALQSGKIIAGYQDGSVRLWNMEAGACEKSFRASGMPTVLLSILGLFQNIKRLFTDLLSSVDGSYFVHLSGVLDELIVGERSWLDDLADQLRYLRMTEAGVDAGDEVMRQLRSLSEMEMYHLLKRMAKVTKKLRSLDETPQGLKLMSELERLGKLKVETLSLLQLMAQTNLLDHVPLQISEMHQSCAGDIRRVLLQTRPQSEAMRDICASLDAIAHALGRFQGVANGICDSVDSTVDRLSAALADCSRYLTTRSGHIGHVTKVAWGPWRRYAASAGSDGVLYLYDTESQVQRMAPVMHAELESPVVDFVWNKERMELVIVMQDGRSISLRTTASDLDQWLRVGVIPIDNGITSQEYTESAPGTKQPVGATVASFSSSGSRYAVGTPAGTISIYTLPDHPVAAPSPPIGLKASKEPISALRWSSNEAHLVSASFDSAASRGQLAVWSTADGSLVCKFSAHDWYIPHLAINPLSDHLLIATGCSDGTVGLWEVDTSIKRGASDPIGIVQPVSPTGVDSLAWNGDGSVLAVGAANKVSVLAVAGTTITGSSESFLHGSAVPSLAFLTRPEGEVMVSAGTDGALGVTGLDSFGVESPGAPGKLTCIAWSHDGSRVVTGSDSSMLHVFDAYSGRVLAKLQGHKQRITCVAFSSQDRLIASGADDSTTRLWDSLGNPKVFANLREELLGHKSSVTCVAWPHSNDSFVATGSDDRTVFVYDAARGTALAHFKGHIRVITNVAWSYDDRYILSTGGGQDKRLNVWDVERVRPPERSSNKGRSPTAADGAPGGFRALQALQLLSRRALEPSWAGPVVENKAPLSCGENELDGSYITYARWIPGSATILVGTAHGRVYRVDASQDHPDKLFGPEMLRGAREGSMKSSVQASSTVATSVASYLKTGISCLASLGGGSSIIVGTYEGCVILISGKSRVQIWPERGDQPTECITSCSATEDGLKIVCSTHKELLVFSRTQEDAAHALRQHSIRESREGDRLSSGNGASPGAAGAASTLEAGGADGEPSDERDSANGDRPEPDESLDENALALVDNGRMSPRETLGLGKQQEHDPSAGLHAATAGFTLASRIIFGVLSGTTTLYPEALVLGFSFFGHISSPGMHQISRMLTLELGPYVERREDAEDFDEGGDGVEAGEDEPEGEDQ